MSEEQSPYKSSIIYESPNQSVKSMRRQSNIFLAGSSPTRRQTILANAGQVEGIERKETIKKPKFNPIVYRHPLLKMLASQHSTIEDGRQIYQLIRDFAFFKKFFKNGNLIQDEESIFLLCSKMQLENFTKGQIIFKEGQDSNNKMYVIAIGKVAIAMKNAFKFDGVVTSPRSNPIPPAAQMNKSLKANTPLINRLGGSSFRLNIQPFDQSPENIDNIISKYGSKINEVQVGQQFGERALLAETAKQATRSASCIAMTDVYLLTLERDDFLEVIKQFKKDSSMKKQMLSSTIPKFDTIVSIQIIENLMYSFKDEVSFRDCRLTEEGISKDGVFIIQSGEVAIFKNFKNQPVLLATIDEFNQGLIGEESLFSENGIHNYTCVVISQEVKLLKISQSSLKLRSPSYCLEGIRQLYLKKEEFRELQLKKIVYQHCANLSSEQEDDSVEENQTRLKRQYDEQLLANQQMTSNFLQMAQVSVSREQIKSQMVRQILKDMGQNLSIKGNQQKDIEKIKSSTYYKSNPVVQALLDTEQICIFAEKDETYEMKNELIKNNLINIFKTTLKSEPKKKGNQMEQIDLEKISQQIYSKTGQDKLDIKNLNIDIFPSSLKRQMYLMLLQQGKVTIPKDVSKSNNVKYMSNLKEKIAKKKRRFDKKQNQFEFVLRTNTSYKEVPQTQTVMINPPTSSANKLLATIESSELDCSNDQFNNIFMTSHGVKLNPKPVDDRKRPKRYTASSHSTFNLTTQMTQNARSFVNTPLTHAQIKHQPYSSSNLNNFISVQSIMDQDDAFVIPRKLKTQEIQPFNNNKTFESDNNRIHSAVKKRFICQSSNANKEDPQNKQYNKMKLENQIRMKTQKDSLKLEPYFHINTQKLI